MTMIWVLLAVAAVIAEMLTGTLYLLVLGAGAGIAALASFFDTGLVVQCLIAALITIAGSLLVSRFRKPGAADMAPDLQGNAEIVAVGEAGQLRVRWRGTEWDARADEMMVLGDAVKVMRQEGNVLRVSRSPRQ